MTEPLAPTMDYAVLDIEAVGEPWDGQGLIVGWRDTSWIGLPPPPVLSELADPSIVKVTFTKYDHRWLRLRGLRVDGPIHDVQVMAWLLDEAQDLSLEACALKYLGLEMDKRIAPLGGRLYFRTDNGKRVPLADAPRDQLAAYCTRDLQATWDLYVTLLSRLDDAGLFEEWDQDWIPFTGVLADMESRGVPVDMVGAADLSADLHVEIDRMNDELLREAGLPDAFNLGSPKQLAQYLFTKGEFVLPGALSKDDPFIPDNFTVTKTGRTYLHGGWSLQGRGLKPVGQTPSGDPTVAAPKLRAKHGGDPWIVKLLDMKERQTIVGTFLDAFPSKGANGRLYGRFNQTGTVTGRLSSSGPNLQNIPAHTPLGLRVRALFRPEPGTVFVHGDYGQLEPRLMAHFSRDPVMLKVYQDPTAGGDVYADMARGIWGDSNAERRNICKTLVLALSYGAGAKKIAQTLTEKGYPTTADTAEGYLDDLQQRYKVFFSWREYVIHKAGVEGYVPTIGGRKRRVAMSDDWHWKDQGHGERQAVNAVVQGSAADVVARVMVRATAELPGYRLLVQVHDELLWECHDMVEPSGLTALRKIAEDGHGFDLGVPLDFQPRVVANWAEGKA